MISGVQDLSRVKVGKAIIQVSGTPFYSCNYHMEIQM